MDAPHDFPQMFVAACERLNAVDSNGNMFSSEGLSLPKEPIIVTQDYNEEHVLGTGTLRLEGDTITVVLCLQPVPPDILQRYACPAFIAEKIEDRGEVRIIHAAKLLSVGLCLTHATPGIAPIRIAKPDEIPSGCSIDESSLDR